MARVIDYHRNIYAAKGSGATSEIVFIGDAVNSTVVFTVAGDGSSSMTLEINNLNGRDEALNPAGQVGGWSTHSIIANPNSYKYITDIPDGTRWLRTIRSESAMSAFVTFQRNV